MTSKTLEELAKQEIWDRLRVLYPTEPGAVLMGWAEKVYTHDADFKLPETQLMQDYRQADAEEKAAKEKKEKIRQEMIRQFKDLDHPVKGVDFREDIRITWKQPELYAWVKTTYPQFADALRADAIDLKKMEEKVASAEMILPPDTCYTQTEVRTITVDHHKGKK